MKRPRQAVNIIMVMNLNHNFSCGERLRQLRSARALSQEQLALQAGITPAYLGLVERGQRNPTVNTIEALCNVLNISLSEFFSTEERKPAIQDDVTAQICFQLKGMSQAEREAYLQLIRLVMKIQHLNP